MSTHLSFTLSRSELRRRILIPKYYDPELDEAAIAAAKEFNLPELRSLLARHDQGSRLGIWMPRENYGTGSIPYVRTSDLNNWRIRADYKKAVSRNVYLSIASKQDIQSNDILMVAHGTYLVGTVAIVTESDLPLVLQDHVFRLRLGRDSPVNAYVLLAALSTRFVRRQIRSKQFSADIIDKIGERHLEIKVPIPKQQGRIQEVSDDVRAILSSQNRIRQRITELLTSDLRMARERASARYAFSVPRQALTKRILIPKYYDPLLADDLKKAKASSRVQWVTIEQLVNEGRLDLGTGVEVGKMAYGTGSIPFIRTTDIADLEVRADPRQGISEEFYQTYQRKAAIKAGDVLLIRDGTYLVGSSAIVTDADIPALVCGGIYRLRWHNDASSSPYALLGLLNLPIVRRQMRARQFTRDVIDTLGRRLLEVVVPDPESEMATALGRELETLVHSKIDLRSRMRSVIASLEPKVPRRLRNRPGWSMNG